MKYIIATSLACGEGVGGGVILYLITSVSAVIIELLSNNTAKIDRNLKKALYETRFRTPEYFWFSPETLEFTGLKLVVNQYQQIIPNEQGLLWSKVLNLYLGVTNNQLRYFTATGELVPTPQETATKIQQEALQAKQEAQISQQKALQAEREVLQVKREALQTEQQLAREKNKAQLLATHLLSLGIDLDNLK
ncbi:MAG: Uma2 family endonuclease [Dolichospermum sp.]